MRAGPYYKSLVILEIASLLSNLMRCKTFSDQECKTSPEENRLNNKYQKEQLYGSVGYS